jgi:hypothetical protein
MKRMWLLIGAAAGASACSTIFGDFAVQDTGGASTGSGATTSTASTGTTGTGGGACVDLQSDALNCGRCGHDCLYGTCSGGVCQPWVVAHLAAVAGSGMAADEKYVVWIDAAQQVRQVGVGGGSVVTASPGALFAGGTERPVLRSGTAAYVSPGGQNGRIYVVPEGSPSAMGEAYLALTLASFHYLALDPTGATAFLVGQSGSSPYAYYLLQCPLVPNGFCDFANMATPIAPSGMPGANEATQLMVNSKYAFWAFADSSSASINRYSFMDSAIDSVGTTSVRGAAIDGSNIYWSDGGSIYSLPQSFVGGPQKLGSSSMLIEALASDGTNVYFGTSTTSASATLSYLPVGGGTPTPMYTSPNAFGREMHVVTAGGAVYWADEKLGTPSTSDIMGIAAP